MESKEVSELEKFGGVHWLASSLGSDYQIGLSSSLVDFNELRKIYGENVLERKPQPSVLDQFLEAIQDTTLIILLVAAGLRILNLTFDWIACFANHLFAHLRLLLAASIGAGGAQYGLGGNTCAARALWEAPGSIQKVKCSCDVLL